MSDSTRLHDGAANSKETKLRTLLDAAFELDKVEMGNQRKLVDELKSDAHRHLVVHKFSTREDHTSTKHWVLSFVFKCQQAYSMWKTCTLAALFKFHLPDIALTSSSQMDFSLTLSFEDTKIVLQYLKPLAEISLFEEVRFVEDREDKVELFEQFFTGSTVNTIEFVPGMQEMRMSWKVEVDDFSPWLTLIRNLKPVQMSYIPMQFFTQELIEFFNEVACIVDKIWITSVAELNTDKEQICSIIKDVLSRKCNNLCFLGRASLPSTQILELTQHFVDTNRIISLTVATNGNVPLNQRIGDYFLVAKGNMVVIEHISKRMKVDTALNGNLHSSESPMNFGKRTISEIARRPFAKRRAIDHKSNKDLEFCPLKDMLNFAQAQRKSSADKILNLEQEYTMNNFKYLNVCNLFLQTEVNHFVMTFHLDCSITRELWCKIFEAAESTVDLVGHTASLGRTGGYMGQTTFLMSRKIPHSKLEELKRMAQLMRPLLIKTHFKMMCCEDQHSLTARVCTMLLKNSSVDHINLLPGPAADCAETDDFSPWFNMVRTVKPETLQYMRFRSTKLSMDFIVHAAQDVTKISLISSGFHEHELPIKFIRELFNGKCYSVQVQRINSQTGATITRKGIEGLLQFLHHTGKRASLMITTEELISETRIGEFTLTMDPRRHLHNHLVIDHISRSQ